MGLFDKLFGRNSSNWDGQKSAEMLNEDVFWQIVEKSRARSSDIDEQEEELIAAIGKLSPREMIGFRLRTDQLLHDTYNSEMWCAGYIMNGGCSDDSFEYFRCWVISRGKEAFYNAKSNPDSLIRYVDGSEFYDFESFWYVALTAFQNKTGKELYEFIDHDNFKIGEGHYPQFEFTWKEEDPESMKAICPELFKRFNQP